MKRSCAVVTVLIAISSMAAATQTRLSILPARKGQIQNVWVEPSPRTSSTPVYLCVSTADRLRVEKVDLRRLSHRFVLTVYWTDPPAGTTGDTSLGQCKQLLGTMHAGTYGVLVQTSYKGMMVDFRTMLFQVQ
jgi:hypothetical protein